MSTTVEPPVTRAEIIEAVTNLALVAGREIYAIEKYTTDPPTPWSRRHAAINDLLDDLDRTP